MKHCINCGGKVALVSLAMMKRLDELGEVYSCEACGGRFLAVKDTSSMVTVAAMPPPPGEMEVHLLREIYTRGQVWDKELDRDTRCRYRRLESMGLVRCRTLVDDRSFWAISIRGLRFLGGHGIGG